MRIILLVSIHCHLPFIPQLIHSLHPRKCLLNASFLLMCLLLVFLPILYEQVIHFLALTDIPSVIYSIKMELFKTLHLANGEFRPELCAAFQASDLTPSSTDWTMKGSTHGGEGVNVAFSVPGFGLAMPAKELLRAFLKDGCLLLILALNLHAECNKIKIK